MNEIGVIHIVGNSKYGGGDVVILSLAERARRAGWRTDILTTDPVFQDKIRESSAGIGIVDLDVLRREIRPLWDLRGLARLTAYLRAHPYTIVHTHTSKAGVVGRLAAHWAGVPVIVHTVHGFAFHEQSHAAARVAYSNIERLAAQFCDAIVCVSNFHREWALQLNIGTPAKVVAIPNGISSERLETTKTRAQARAELGLAEGEFAIFSAGRLATQKGFEYLIRSIAQLKERMPCPFRVILAGEGVLREELDRLCSALGVEDKVQFLGFRQDLGDLLSAADLVALPSLWEGLSISLLEAMAAAKPVVTTRIGSNLEVVAHEQSALLVEPANAGQLADAIVRCARDPVLAGSLAEQAHLRFQRDYTYDRMLDEYMRTYERLIETKYATQPQAAHA